MADEVISHADLSNNPDVKNIESAIIIAEERFVRKILCRSLYDDFRTLKNVTVDDANKADLQAKVNIGNTGPAKVLNNGDVINAIELVDNEWYKKLWYEYLWKICAECVAYVSTPTRWLQSKSAGEMLNNPPDITQQQKAASGELKDIRWKMDKMLMDRIDPLLESMKEWLCENKDQFPKFDCIDCNSVLLDGVSHLRKTGWIHGVYDEDQAGCDNETDGIAAGGGEVIITEN